MADAPRTIWSALTFAVSVRCVAGTPELGAEGELGAGSVSIFHGIPQRMPAPGAESQERPRESSATGT